MLKATNFPGFEFLGFLLLAGFLCSSVTATSFSIFVL